jgi:FMN-dependent NADH-azoreductase
MEKKVLYINACARSESRTDRIARALLERLGGLQEEVKLAEMDLQPLSEERLNRRTWLIEEADYTDAMFDLARQFQQADEIVIAAPYWDLSFPAILKLYLENIYVTGACFGIYRNRPAARPVPGGKALVCDHGRRALSAGFQLPVSAHPCRRILRHPGDRAYLR